MGVKLRLATVLLCIAFISCQYFNNEKIETNSYNEITLYTNEQCRFFAMYFHQNNKNECLIVYKVSGNYTTSDIQSYFEVFIKSLNRKVFPNLNNGFILIENEFLSEFFEINYISKIDSTLNVNYNKKIHKIIIERNATIKLFIRDN